MDGAIKVLKVACSPLSLPAGTLTLTGNHQSAMVMEMSGGNGPGAGGNSNSNLVDLGKKLLDACRNGETEHVRSLMQTGAPFTTDWLGTSPLHFAAQYGHSETAEVLLRAGVSRDTRTKVDRTPLHVAAQEGHLAIVNTLLIHGADVDAKDLLKMTPLHWAVERGHSDVVDCLLTNGADVNVISKFDKTPVDIAMDMGRLDMASMLQKYTSVSRPKPDPKPQQANNSKARPTVLPNKANRTSKVVKQQPQQQPQQIGANVKQLFVPTGLNNLQKAINVESLKKLFAGGNTVSLTGDSNETSNVLSSLAALAEATSSPSSSTSNQLTSEALQWLEAHGLSSSSALNEDTIFQSALESGQSVSLTEAGKLALNWNKDQNQTTSGSVSVGSKNSNSKVITIVADSTQLPQIINSSKSTPIVLVSGSNQINLQETSESLSSTANILAKNRKGTKPVTFSNVTKTYLNQGSNKPQVSVTVKDATHESCLKERERLERELEQAKKQAEEYKAMWREKEREAEQYRKRLEALSANGRPL